jgi:hypothetical protein
MGIRLLGVIGVVRAAPKTTAYLLKWRLHT